MLAAKTWADALENLVQERDVQLFFDGRRQDRRGRWLAHLYLRQGEDEDRFWVQGHLVEEGHARLVSFAG